jgi:hypothetical protein
MIEHPAPHRPETRVPAVSLAAGRALAWLVIAVALSGATCQTNSRDQLLATETSQLALRSIQARAFETTDVEKTLRSVISTLQDLSFVIDRADSELGTVSATKLDGYQLRMTVTVRPRGEKQTIVRASAQYENQAITDAAPYQQFFASLEQAMFLTAQQVD